MTTKFVKAIALFIAISACSCQSNPEPPDNSTGLAGTWEWTSTDGGLANHIHDTPASTGNQMELTLTADGKFFKYTDGKLVSKGTYVLADKECIHTRETKPYITFSTPSDPGMMIERVDSNVLELSDEAYDGIGMQFKRVISEPGKD